mgnify:FL=1|tara:strand:+ start:338 stop:604 length:267 start_codon:yes stop_codon:yes gene_type:complete
MKKLLLLILSFSLSNSVPAQSNGIDIIDKRVDERGIGYVVVCVADYAFINRFTGAGILGTYVQIMKRHGKGTQATMFPMTCDEYRKVK